MSPLTTVAAIAFWAAAVLIVYAYLGYAVLLWAYAKIRTLPVRTEGAAPSVSVVMVAHDEETNLPAKLANLASLQYPRDRVEFVVASDGSTDRTAELLREAGDWLTPLVLPEARGKAAALNAAVAAAKGEILVFFDVRQMVDADALLRLGSCFVDPMIGAASGELLLEDPQGQLAGDALGLYWRIEKLVRRLESATGSVVGVTGAIYAMRRELYGELPEGTILDDVLVPMNVARMGRRIIFQPAAIARDRIFQKPGKEFGRKVRTLTGNYQLLRLAPWLLTPANPLLFRFVSHKLLRLLAPFLLVILLLSSVVAAGLSYKLALLAQLVFYALAAWGWMSPSARRFRAVSVAETFAMLNVAAAFAFYNFVAGRKKVWV